MCPGYFSTMNEIRKLKVPSAPSLPPQVLSEIFQHVDQFDLVNLAVTCKEVLPIAMERLYRRVSVILSADFALDYAGDSRAYVLECGLKVMDSTLILKVRNVIKFLHTIRKKPDLVRRVKYFVFDKCNEHETFDIPLMQSKYMDFFGQNSWDLNFLHVSFLEPVPGLLRLQKFLSNRNVREKIFKLFIKSVPELSTPIVPPGLTDLFLILDEAEMEKLGSLDLSKHPLDSFNSLLKLTCSTKSLCGLEILKRTKLNNDVKLNLKDLTVIHCHEEKSEASLVDRRLDFHTIEEKVQVTNLVSLHLKVDCNEHRLNNCDCFSDFYQDLALFLLTHGGLPNLTCFELELFPNLEWLRPHQILDAVLTPLGNFVKTLRGLTRLTLDFSTPGLKMFGNELGMSSPLLNKLNEKLMEAFFLCLFTPSDGCVSKNLKHFQAPDFLTSFVYYKPNFLESFLHTCKCWGCALVLDRLDSLFFPMGEEHPLDPHSSYYILMAYMLSKLQTDREACYPIKAKRYNFRQYPLYKGPPNMLHQHFHETGPCKCILDAQSDMNIDNLVTTYVMHQLRPMVEYLVLIFENLETMMIHGIYYHRKDAKMVSTFDREDYPAEFLQAKTHEIATCIEPEGPFGHFGMSI